MDVPPGTGVTSVTTPAQAALLRRAWFDVAATAAPQLIDLPSLLDTHLSELEAAGRLDESSLLGVAEDASQYALEHGAGDVARTLSKRLRRAIYEFLLALDAVNPAELDPAGAAAPFAPPPPAPAPRAPVAMSPGDVSGGDDGPAGGAAPPVPHAEAPPVPLWEQMSGPVTTREVYRVASREVTPVAGAAPAVEETDAAPASEDDLDTAALVAEVFDGAAQDMEAEVFTAEGLEEPDSTGEPVAEAAEPIAPMDLVAEPDSTVEPVAGAAEPIAPEEGMADPQAAVMVEPQAAVEEGMAEPQAAVEETEGIPQAAGEDTAVSETAQPEPPLVSETALPEPPLVSWNTPAPAGPESTWAPLVDVPPVPAPETDHGSNGNGDGLKPPRDLLRVPRQFRRLPPLPSRHPEDEIVLPAEPSVTWTSVPTASPAPETTVDAAAAPAAAPSPSSNAEPEDDDQFGVPALPWPVDADSAPEPEAAVLEEVAATAVAPEEEDFGLPFAPLAEDLPKPPPVFEEPVRHAEAPAFPVPAVPQPVDEQPPASPEQAPVFPAPAFPEQTPAFPTPAFPAPAAEQAFPAPTFLEPAPAFPEQAFPALPFATPAAEEPVAYPDLPPTAPAAAGQPWSPVPVAPSAAGSPFPIAPREGFHLTDPGALDLALGTGEQPALDNPFTSAVPPVNVPPQVHVAQPTPPAPPAAPAPAAPQAPGGEQHDDGSWRVRQSPRAQLLAERMAQKRREEAARVAFQAASVHDEDEHRGRRRRKEESLPDLPTARRQLDEHLRKKRGAEAAALLQRLAQELGGREIADLALDSGDRCRALGQGRSATNCYLAAWRADPLYETPLWRLSDVCLNEQEIELAVGYLERIADLMRSRGDDEGAIGVYRKIAMIAPERQDVRDVIRLAKTTGRLDV